MINYKQSINLCFAVALTVFICSCGSNSKKVAAEAEAEAFEKAENQLLNEIDKVVHDMPPPSEVPYMLQATGSDFNGDLINSIDNVSKYENVADKAAMNLGAYATDIGYLSSYDQVQDALKYMEACQKLADQIGIASAFELDLMERFEKNLGNKDSLANLINYAMEVAEEKLEATDRLQTVALILSGSYIEGLYLSVMVIDTYPEDLLPEASRNLILEPLVKIIIDQKEPLNDVVKLLKDLKSDDTIAGVVAEFDILRVLYQEDLAEIDKKIAEGDPNFTLNKDMLVDIIAEVKRIRAEMVR
ncbi:hypothetical protein N7E81_11875 [Reichenbachiella carrageenanivorans]|uniref:Imelysin n=1 Tax=Reichenbachiella carrageenanivorans TaxID=2979869 RepID=A0ABY6CVW5_9BACT|nr:hypothetical protein [Reichenbachiella carrageenanivorans]UXX78056.1 hypothetical protein N7E81_11875 [Reichenbachiella carrageenanivorans]